MANELISREALLAEYDRVHIGEPGNARKLMEDAPTVDAVEVIHAYWMYADELDESGDLQAYCSNCMAFDLHAPRKKNDVPYCWRCGAKMDGDGNG